jgi:hypothetical protein
MPTYSISVDLSHLIPAARNAVFPALAATVEAVALRAEEQWKRFAAGEPLPDGRVMNVRSGQYLRSINHRQISQYAVTVESVLAYAEALERGTPAWDMRKLLNSSLKVRISKKGKRYLIIPFRHDTGKALSGGNPMPESVHQWWQDKKASFVESQMRRPVHSDLRGRTPKPNDRVYATDRAEVILNGPLLTVAARKYKWGDRLSKGAAEGLGLSPQQANRAQGMVNFRRPGKSGGAAHSQFITFRVLSENSRPGSWMQKARAGFYPARATADMFRPIAEDLFQKAVEEDIRNMLPG